MSALLHCCDDFQSLIPLTEWRKIFLHPKILLVRESNPWPLDHTQKKPQPLSQGLSWLPNFPFFVKKAKKDFAKISPISESFLRTRSWQRDSIIYQMTSPLITSQHKSGVFSPLSWGNLSSSFFSTTIEIFIRKWDEVKIFFEPASAH